MRDNRQRAKLAQTFLWIMLGIGVATLLLEAYELKVLSDLRDADYSNITYLIENLETMLLVVAGVGFILLAISILTYVFYIQWFRRAYYNMHILRPTGLKYSEGMAAGAWFIPVFWWWGPYQIMKDLYINAGAMLANKGIVEHDPKRMNTVNIWWGLWISANILQSVSGQGEEFEPETQIIFVYISMVASVLSIIAAFFAVKVVKNYAELEVHLPKLQEDGARMPITTSDDLLDSGI